MTASKPRIHHHPGQAKRLVQIRADTPLTAPSTVSSSSNPDSTERKPKRKPRTPEAKRRRRTNNKLNRTRRLADEKGISYEEADAERTAISRERGKHRLEKRMDKRQGSQVARDGVEQVGEVMADGVASESHDRVGKMDLDNEAKKTAVRDARRVVGLLSNQARTMDGTELVNLWRRTCGPPDEITVDLPPLDSSPHQLSHSPVVSAPLALWLESATVSRFIDEYALGLLLDVYGGAIFQARNEDSSLVCLNTAEAISLVPLPLALGRSKKEMQRGLGYATLKQSVYARPSSRPSPSPTLTESSVPLNATFRAPLFRVDNATEFRNINLVDEVTKMMQSPPSSRSKSEGVREMVSILESVEERAGVKAELERLKKVDKTLQDQRRAAVQQGLEQDVALADMDLGDLATAREALSTKSLDGVGEPGDYFGDLPLVTSSVGELKKRYTFLANYDTANAKVPGVTTPYGYINPSDRPTFATMHVEDGLLPSLNHLHAGKEKGWIVVRPNQINKLHTAVRAAANLGNGFKADCTQFLRHHAKFITIDFLIQHGIKFSILMQDVGDTVVIMGPTAHEVVNLGANFASAINLVEHASTSKALLCGCECAANPTSVGRRLLEAVLEEK